MTEARDDGAEGAFDLYGDLEAAYEKAKKDGCAEIVETLDAFGLWNEDEQVSAKFMLRAWWAINGDTVQQRELAWCFDWVGSEPEEERDPRYDKPHLAVYWYDKAARAGDAMAQNNLANIYCSEGGALWNGRLGIHWYEKAAAQKLPTAMRGLARCLRCGKCRKGGGDPVRAKSLLAEADKIEKTNEGRK